MLPLALREPPPPGARAWERLVYVDHLLDMYTLASRVVLGPGGLILEQGALNLDGPMHGAPCMGLNRGALTTLQALLILRTAV